MSIRRLSLFRVFLFLISVHSLCVGAGLIFVPLSVYDIFGFGDYHGAFFKIQGGIFHLIMGLVYLQASRNPLKNVSLIWLTVVAKFTATVFLLAYYLFAERIWIVLISGLGDLLMGLIVLLLYLSVSKD
jgi:hypothetical protein